MRPPPRGFTYLVLLFGLAVGGAALAALGTHWQQAAQRERETELVFRGLQLRDALQRFHDQTPDGQPAHRCHPYGRAHSDCFGLCRRDGG
jgi:type II secretory pathway pseudopilin PulG